MNFNQQVLAILKSKLKKNHGDLVVQEENLPKSIADGFEKSLEELMASKQIV